MTAAVAMITDAQRDFFGIKEKGGPGMIHDRRQDRDAAVDAMAKGMANATRRALLDGQRQRNWWYLHLSLIAAKAQGTRYATEMADATRRAFMNKQRQHVSAGRRDWRYQGPRAMTTIKTETKSSMTVRTTTTRTTVSTSSGGTRARGGGIGGTEDQGLRPRSRPRPSAAKIRTTATRTTASRGVAAAPHSQHRPTLSPRPKPQTPPIIPSPGTAAKISIIKLTSNKKEMKFGHYVTIFTKKNLDETLVGQPPQK